MEEKQEQGAKLALYDIDQALAGASDEELAEFVETWGSRRMDALDAITAWDYLTHKQQRAAFEHAPWIAGRLLPGWKERFLKKLDGPKYEKLPHCAAEPKTEPAPEPEPQKAPWWQFWK